MIYPVPQEISLLDLNLEEILSSDSSEEQKQDELDKLLAQNARLAQNWGGLVAHIRNLTSFRDSLQAEIKRLSQRVDKIDSKIERLSDFLGYHTNHRKISTFAGEVSWRQSTAVEVLDESQIPADFSRTKIIVEVDKAAIKKKLQAGETVEGAVLTKRLNFNLK